MSEPLRILVVGSGGREHALAWRLSLDRDVETVFVAPGNDGMGSSFERISADPLDPHALGRAVRERGIHLVVVGPEAPLAAGVADALRDSVPVFGPGRAGARIESSKWFAKQLMVEGGIPTARATLHEDAARIRDELRRRGYPVVLKADGLAAGKGVCVASDRAQAEDFVRRVMIERALGAAGDRILLEEWLEGEEGSLMVLTDGTRYRLLPAARDYKRAREGDQGSNTGGMGAYAPSPLGDEALRSRVAREVVDPALAALRDRGIDYRGALYCGLMMTGAGPKVLEFNCRFGDPETEAVMPIVQEGLARPLLEAASGRLTSGGEIAARGAAVSVAVCDAGYPDVLRGNGWIEGLDELESDANVRVFHAALRREGDHWRITGGRAAHVCATGGTLEEARQRVYAAVDRLGGGGWRVRRDIAASAVPAKGGP